MNRWHRKRRDTSTINHKQHIYQMIDRKGSLHSTYLTYKVRPLWKRPTRCGTYRWLMRSLGVYGTIGQRLVTNIYRVMGIVRWTTQLSWTYSFVGVTRKFVTDIWAIIATHNSSTWRPPWTNYEATKHQLYPYTIHWTYLYSLVV